MKNALILETHVEILNAHMHGDYPELALVIPAKEPEKSDTLDETSMTSQSLTSSSPRELSTGSSTSGIHKPIAQQFKPYEIGQYYLDKGVYAGEIKKEDGFYGIFVALEDFEDEDCEDEFTWGEAMRLSLPEDYHIPDIRELALIHLNIEDVNAGLDESSGQKISGDYWSSTEYSTSNAWGFIMYSGSRYYSSKNGNALYVRPVLAVKL